MGVVRDEMGGAQVPSYVTEFNDAKGGVYAMEWAESSISVWFFPHDSPGYTEYFSQSNATAVTSPDPSTWGPPMARFSGSGCDFSERFVDMKIVFNTALCGVFREAYWEVEGLRWFQKL
ncbi:hypothetical protein GGP41_008894 [Bipolaris sorokiniana]|uniref:GH16 domain-containing protein n=1 Tax=Cochliobolus sativus TaxID=45130 RepID=A0A8H5Z8W1_COCSA|nr:hypothetical protein GGP41_008894 [Bipolaris sorokiniana]